MNLFLFHIVAKVQFGKKFKIVMHNSSYSEDPDSPDHTNTDFVACPLCMELYVKKSSTATLQ